MRVLVTGATGFIGKAVTRRVLADGHAVRAIVRDPNRADVLRKMGVECHAGDLGDRDSLRRAMTGIDRVFHVAGWYKVGVRDPEAAIRTNVHGTRHVLEAMREMGVSKGVYTSTLAVNSDTSGRVVDEDFEFTGRHLSVYDRTKAEAHAMARSFAASGLPLVIVQPGLVYGPGDTSSIGTMFRRFLQRTLPPVPRRTAFCWAHVDDIARGHLLAMEHGQTARAYFLAGPVHTLVDALRVASALTGIPPPRTVSPALLRVGANVTAVLERLVALPPEFTSEGLRVLAGTTYLGSADRAHRELGWTARPLRDGLKETLDEERRRLGSRPEGAG